MHHGAPIDTNSTLARFTRGIIRFRWLVVAAWIAIILAGSLAGSKLQPLLSDVFSVRGSEAEQARDIMEREFGQRDDGKFVIVATGRDGSAPRLVAALERAGAEASKVVPDSRAGTPEVLSPSVATITVESPLSLSEAMGLVDDVREALPPVEGATLHVTGSAAFQHDTGPVMQEDMKKGELQFAVPLALLILAFVFGTLGFALPFMFAMASIPATMGVVWIFANMMDLSTYTMNMVLGIGLGISIDYSLLMYYRYREERLRQPDGDRVEPIVITALTAGRTVVFSGTAVAIGLALLILMPLTFMQGLGVAGLIIPIVSVICAITLMPVMMYLMAHHLERARFVPKRVLERRDDSENNGWARIARAIMRRPMLFAATSATLLLAMAAPVTTLNLTAGTDAGIPAHIESMRGLKAMEEAVGKGALGPSLVVVDSGEEGGALAPEVQAAAARLASQLSDDPEVANVAWDPAAPVVDESRRYLVMSAVGTSAYGTDASDAFVERLRGELIPGARFPGDVTVLAGGTPAFGVDLVDKAYDAFPWLVAGVLAMGYVLLLRAFRSLLLPLKAIVLNLMSIGAAYGMLVLVFTTSIADTLGLQRHDEVAFWVPIFMFAVLFGLSMDYEVFLVSRMREEWDRLGNNEAAVAMGLAKTGRLVTAAGLIMVAAFGGFMFSQIVELQQFGFGLAAAILIDVTIVRALLLPSAMKLFGRWNWWLPAGVARIARVEPSPLAPTMVDQPRSDDGPGDPDDGDTPGAQQPVLTGTP